MECSKSNRQVSLQGSEVSVKNSTLSEVWGVEKLKKLRDLRFVAKLGKHVDGCCGIKFWVKSKYPPAFSYTGR